MKKLLTFSFLAIAGFMLAGITLAMEVDKNYPVLEKYCQWTDNQTNYSNYTNCNKRFKSQIATVNKATAILFAKKPTQEQVKVQIEKIEKLLKKTKLTTTKFKYEATLERLYNYLETFEEIEEDVNLLSDASTSFLEYKKEGEMIEVGSYVEQKCVSGLKTFPYVKNGIHVGDVCYDPRKGNITCNVIGPNNAVFGYANGTQMIGDGTHAYSCIPQTNTTTNLDQFLGGIINNGIVTTGTVIITRDDGYLGSGNPTETITEGVFGYYNMYHSLNFGSRLIKNTTNNNIAIKDLVINLNTLQNGDYSKITKAMVLQNGRQIAGSIEDGKIRFRGANISIRPNTFATIVLFLRIEPGFVMNYGDFATIGFARKAIENYVYDTTTNREISEQVYENYSTRKIVKNTQFTVVTDKVTCNFKDGTLGEEQKCYAKSPDINGQYPYCKGVFSCSMDFRHNIGKQPSFNSSCNQNTQTITIDGNPDVLTFMCQNTQPEVISEETKCLFTGSNTMQKCYAYDYANNLRTCEGITSCTVSLKHNKGQMITRKSSCGGYAYTTMDGTNEYAPFVCQSTQSGGMGDLTIQRGEFRLLPQTTGGLSMAYFYMNFKNIGSTSTKLEGYGYGLQTNGVQIPPYSYRRLPLSQTDTDCWTIQNGITTFKKDIMPGASCFITETILFTGTTLQVGSSKVDFSLSELLTNPQGNNSISIILQQ